MLLPLYSISNEAAFIFTVFAEPKPCNNYDCVKACQFGSAPGFGTCENGFCKCSTMMFDTIQNIINNMK